MSDYIVKIIPQDHTYSVTREQADCVLKFIKTKLNADEIKASIYETPAFVDCGSNLQTINCPHCETRLEFSWWQESMDAASEGGFKDLSVIMPCCGNESTLNNLRYDFPCGFACIEFDIRNPSTDFDEETLSVIKDLLGCPIRMIHAHM